MMEQLEWNDNSNMAFDKNKKNESRTIFRRRNHQMTSILSSINS
jgi:hypothetical protein